MERLARGAALGAFVVAALALPLTSALPSAFAADEDPSQAAVDHLVGRQGPDGGFGPGAATPEAVSAIAQQGQSGDTWSTKEAIDAVSAARNGRRSPLDALDALAEDNPDPTLAAQLISRAVVALGLDPENFDPAGNGHPVNLIREVHAGRSEDGSYGPVTATAEAVLALVLVERQVTVRTMAVLADAQQENGGWNTDGDPEAAAIDPATTGLVLEALAASGSPTDGDSPTGRGLALLARTQLANGGWPAARAGAVDPTATVWAMGAVRAHGFDPEEGCWRDAVAPAVKDDPYTSPADAIAAVQQADGAIGGGGAGLTATAVGVQGLLGRWLPTIREAVTSCSNARSVPAVNLSFLFLGVFSAVIVVGVVWIMRQGSR